MADPYITLGVARDVDQAAIKKAYRKLAKELHPDRNKGRTDTAERFSEVAQAYDLLSDTEQRALFDRGEIDEQGNPRAPYGFEDFDGHGPFGGRGPFTAGGDGETSYHFSGDPGEFEDVFGDLFGRAGRRRHSEFKPRGSDVLYRMQIGLEDVATGEAVHFRLEDGGKIDVMLPPNAHNGTRLRVAGKGRPGPGGTGDAILELQLKPHRFFKRDGDNVRLELPVRWDEAVLGAKIHVPTVNGSVMLTIPKGSSSGKTLRVKGKGMRKTDGSRGYQLVKLVVDLPSGDTQLESWAKEWRKTHDDNPRSKLGV